MMAMEFAYHPIGDALLTWRCGNITPRKRGGSKQIVQFSARLNSQYILYFSIVSLIEIKVVGEARNPASIQEGPCRNSGTGLCSCLTPHDDIY
jgi:hypothetical protein